MSESSNRSNLNGFPPRCRYPVVVPRKCPSAAADHLPRSGKDIFPIPAAGWVAAACLSDRLTILLGLVTATMGAFFAATARARRYGGCAAATHPRPLLRRAPSSRHDRSQKATGSHHAWMQPIGRRVSKTSSLRSRALSGAVEPQSAAARRMAASPCVASILRDASLRDAPRRDPEQRRFRLQRSLFTKI
jgi:hypothetical protein